jgi:hypothetical protein
MQVETGRIETCTWKPKRVETDRETGRIETCTCKSKRVGSKRCQESYFESFFFFIIELLNGPRYTLNVQCGPDVVHATNRSTNYEVLRVAATAWNHHHAMGRRQSRRMVVHRAVIRFWAFSALEHQGALAMACGSPLRLSFLTLHLHHLRVHGQ